MKFDEASTLLHIHTISSNNYQIARKGPTWLLQTAVSHCKKNPREADCPLACSNFMIGSDLIQVQSLYKQLLSVNMKNCRTLLTGLVISTIYCR